MIKYIHAFVFLVFSYSSFVAQISLLRGPYLQKASENSITIRWRTTDSSNSLVRFGLNATQLSDSVLITGLRNEHIVQINGLQTASKYFYAIGNSDTILEGNLDNFFITHPAIGAKNKYRFWVAGDCGTGYKLQLNVRNQFEAYRGSNDIHGFLLLGDNAYWNGLDHEYQTGFFDVYKEQLKHFNLWPAPGNHDYWATPNYLQGFSGTPYFKIFTTPENGEAGGVASNNPAYYSYNYGNIHFVSLDSYGQESSNFKKMYDTTSAQIVWLKNDLAANTQRWTILYWHHPPYTKGSHNSDTEGDLVAIRENVLRIIERYKVDLVLNGHSHNYERSYLINGHYGSELSHNPAVHNVSSSSAKYDLSPNSCPYIKNGTEANGTIYLVAGNAGKVTFTSPGYPHNAMAFSETVHGGSLLLEIESNRMDCKFIGDDGNIRDQFTVMKNVGQKQVIGTLGGQNIFLSSNYIGSYNWNNNLGTNNSVVVVPSLPNSTYTVHDDENCVSDTFQINLITAVPTSNFSFPSALCQQQPVAFKDLSSQTPFAWSWTFTGANIMSSNVQNPTLIFQNAGIQTVTLTTTNLLGVSAVYSQTIFVNPPPNVNLIASALSACKNSNVITLTGTPSGGSFTGNAVLSNTFNPANAALGPNIVTYNFTNNLGCRNTTAIAIQVNNLPSVEITNLMDTVCINSGPINLTGLPIGGVFSGIGVINNTYIPVISGQGTNMIVYTYSDMNGCTNTALKEVAVDNCLGLNDNKIINQTVIIYPNPSLGNLKIQTNKKQALELVLLDDAGRLLRTVILNKSNGYSVDFNLKNGIYFLQGKADGKNIKEKIIVNK